MSEIRDIPEGWGWIRLGDLVDNQKQDLVDGPFGSNLKSVEYVETGIPVFKIQNIKVNKFIDKKMSFVTHEKAQTLIRHSFKAGDLIITKLGEPLGLCCKVPPQYPFGIIVADLMRLRPSKSKIFDEYLIYAINSDVVKKQFKSITKGTTRARVNLTIVRDIKIPVPSLEQQQVIVAKIDELLSELDNGKQHLQTALQQLKVYRQSLLKWAFEGKLTNDNVKDGELPEDWKWVKIEEIATVGTGATPLKGNRQYYDNGKIAWVTSGALNDEFVRNASDYVTELALKETNLSVYPKNTLLLAMYGEGKTRGKCSQLLIEAATNQAIAAIHFTNHDEQVRPFLKYFLLKNYNDIRRLSSGGVQPNLNLGIVKKTLIPLPSIEEQQLIVDELESKLTICDNVEETIKQSLQQAETLRQSILKKAFEGKLV